MPSIWDKGQLISKGNFIVHNSPKNELENVNFCPSLLGAETFRSFFGIIEKTEMPLRN